MSASWVVPLLLIVAGGMLDGFVLFRLIVHRGCLLCWLWMSFLFVLMLMGMVMVVIGWEQRTKR